MDFLLDYCDWKGVIMDPVELRDYHFEYAIALEPTLKGINLTLEEGKLYALVGPNGAGKTTLANAIRGFVPKFHVGDESGDVLVFGKNMKDLELMDLATEIGYVFQNPFTQMSGAKQTVFGEIAYGLENIGVPKDEIAGRVEEVMKLTKTDELRDRNPLELSGGQQQRVALASTLVMEQSVYIIDEPTSQLDPQSTDAIFEIIQGLKEQGKTVLLIEHKINQIAEFADEIIVMNDGQIVMQGTPHEIFQTDEAEEYGSLMPTATQIAFDMQDKGYEFDTIPTTLAELEEALK